MYVPACLPKTFPAPSLQFSTSTPAPRCGTVQLRTALPPLCQTQSDAPWARSHMTWHAPAHDIFGFKMTSRQRGAQRAGRPSVWEKRSSRRRSSLLSSLMTASHSPLHLSLLSSLSLSLSNSSETTLNLQDSPPSLPHLPFFSCTSFFLPPSLTVRVLLCLTPTHPSTPPGDVSR